MGLGLSICKSLAEAFGGSITATSEGIGKGAAFTVRLPQAAVSSQIEPAVPAHPAQAKPAAGSLRILLVEDNADTARIMSRLLRTKGYVVETAGDVASALECMKRPDFDLLVSDLGLPDPVKRSRVLPLAATVRRKTFARAGKPALPNTWSSRSTFPHFWPPLSVLPDPGANSRRGRSGGRPVPTAAPRGQRWSR
jgi:hypothetical protein